MVDLVLNTLINSQHRELEYDSNIPYFQTKVWQALLGNVKWPNLPTTQKSNFKYTANGNFFWHYGDKIVA